jgi:uncharacterized damage-inducible protein DinB
MQTLAERPIATRPRACDPALAALDRALEDIAAVVAAITPEAYRAKPLPQLSGSIGEHVRHCLDHIMTLVSAGPSSELSYDRRARGTRIETDPAAALRSMQILRIQVAVGRWSKRADEPIVVSSTISRGGAEVNTTSTLARELAFVLNHTIHHQATIGLLASLAGFDVPDGFGCAPSTPRAVANRGV